MVGGKIHKLFHEPRALCSLTHAYTQTHRVHSLVCSICQSLRTTVEATEQNHLCNNSIHSAYFHATKQTHIVTYTRKRKKCVISVGVSPWNARIKTCVHTSILISLTCMNMMHSITGGYFLTFTCQKIQIMSLLRSMVTNAFDA